jgi:hypothetical protein
MSQTETPRRAGAEGYGANVEPRAEGNIDDDTGMWQSFSGAKEGAASGAGQRSPVAEAGSPGIGASAATGPGTWSGISILGGGAFWRTCTGNSIGNIVIVWALVKFIPRRG